MRTKNLASPTSWRAWDGQAYSVRFINPYVETSEDPADHVCEPVSSANSGPLRGFELNSLTYNTYYDKWMAVGQTVKSNIPGFYFATSDDLIHWSEPIRLMEGASTRLPRLRRPGSRPRRRGARSSFTGRNFEYADQTVNLYFTRFNYFYPGGGSCSMTLDRDLIKYPIQFSNAADCAVTLQDLAAVAQSISMTLSSSTAPDRPMTARSCNTTGTWTGTGRSRS